MHPHVLTSMMNAAAQVTPDQWCVVIGASLVAAATDLKSRRIPNWLTVPLAVTGLLAALGRDGVPGLGWAVAGCGLLALPYILLFALGNGGAGGLGGCNRALGPAPDGLPGLAAPILTR